MKFDIFFFQAEDGIRDGRVTGVQTCALPILFRTDLGTLWAGCVSFLRIRVRTRARSSDERVDASAVGRSEERRVGKECRSRRARYALKNMRGVAAGSNDDVELRMLVGRRRSC